MQITRNQRYSLIILCSAAFLVPFMGSAINLSLPQISETFSMKAVSLSWVMTAYLITTAIFQVPFARLADLIGRRKGFIIGVSVFSLATFLCGLATSGIMLIVLRAISGLGAALMFGTNMAILTAVFPADQRGKVLGINTSVVYLALASGPFLGGFLTHYVGWQSLFFVCALLGVIVSAGALRYLKGEWIEAKGEPFDYIGTVVYAVGLFFLIFGFSELPQRLGFISLGIGVIAFTLFVLYELRCKFPVFNVRLFSKNRSFSLSSLAALINYASVSAVAFLMSLYLQFVRGFDAQQAGMILIVQACVQSVVSLYAGRLSDRISPALLATSGMLICTLGLGCLVFLSPETPLFLIFVLFIMLGLGFGLFSSPNTNMIMSSVDKKYYGQASATMGTMRLTGQAFSMGIAMMAISLFVGNELIVPELYPHFMKSLHITFAICSVLCLLGTFASAARRSSLRLSK